VNRQADSLSGVALGRPSGAPWVLVTGGKGGVGKSTVALNLAAALAQGGRRVLLVDLDLGLGNLHVMLGLESPRTVEDFLAGDRELDDCILEAGANLDLLPAANGSHELARPDSARRRRLVEALESLAERYDVLVADAPAGIGPDTLAFAARADVALCVTTPDPTALTDAYGVIKALDLWSKERNISLPTPELVVNLAASLEEAEALHRRLSGVCERFLARRPRLGAWLPRSRDVEQSVLLQAPLVRSQPTSLASRAIVRLADRLLAILPGADQRPRRQAQPA